MTDSYGKRYSLKGFLQLYLLQTSNDEQETWKDLVRINCGNERSYSSNCRKGMGLTEISSSQRNDIELRSIKSNR